MPPTQRPSAAITPQGVRDGDPAVLGALARRRGPAVLAMAREICDPAHVVRAAADGFARFRAEVARPGAAADAHPDALLLRAARRAAVALAPLGPDLGCAPASVLIAQRAEGPVPAARAAQLTRHLATCEHCRDLLKAITAGEEAYRDAPDAALAPDELAPIVAALAAAAPVRSATAPHPPAADEEAPGLHLVPEPEAPPAAGPSLEMVPGPTMDEEAQHEAVEDAPEPEAEAGTPAKAPDLTDPAAEEPAPHPDEERAPPAPAAALPPATPAFRSSYYELPPLPPRRRGGRARQAARAARSAADRAAALSRRAGAAARRRGGDARAPDETDGPEITPLTQTTATWQRVEEIVFPARPPLPSPPPPALTTTGRRRPSLPRRTVSSRPRARADVALPVGLVVVAVLVVLAVTGAFGGDTKPSATARSGNPVATAAAQSVTSISLDEAGRVSAAPARAATPTSP